MTNYVLIRNNCYNKIRGCIQKSADNSQCLACAQGYQLAGGCCRVSPNPNCLTYNQCACVACKQGSYLSRNGICLPNPQGCDIFDAANSVCLRCVAGFYLTINKFCQIADSMQNGCMNG